jgi:hypothetical protein
MFCTNCGKKISKSIAFCSACGEKNLEFKAPTAKEVPEAPLAEAPVVQEITPSGVSNSYVWALSLAPLVYGLADIIFATSIPSSTWLNYLATGLYLGTNIALANADSKQLEKVGIELPKWQAYILVPLYLYNRAKLVKSSQANVLVWIFAFVISIALPSISATTIGTQVDTGRTQDAITSWLDEKGYPGASVSCPGTVLSKPGAIFDCLATLDGETVDIQVTIQNTAGDVVWKVLN